MTLNYCALLLGYSILVALGVGSVLLLLTAIHSAIESLILIGYIRHELRDWFVGPRVESKLYTTIEELKARVLYLEDKE